MKKNTPLPSHVVSRRSPGLALWLFVVLVAAGFAIPNQLQAQACRFCGSTLQHCCAAATRAAEREAEARERVERSRERAERNRELIERTVGDAVDGVSKRNQENYRLGQRIELSDMTRFELESLTRPSYEADPSFKGLDHELLQSMTAEAEERRRQREQDRQDMRDQHLELISKWVSDPDYKPIDYSNNQEEWVNSPPGQFTKEFPMSEISLAAQPFLGTPPDPYVRMPNGEVVFNESYGQAQAGLKNNNPFALQDSALMKLDSKNIGGILPPAMTPYEKARKEFIASQPVPAIRNSRARYEEYRVRMEAYSMRAIPYGEWLEQELRRRISEEDRKSGVLPSNDTTD